MMGPGAEKGYARRDRRLLWRLGGAVDALGSLRRAALVNPARRQSPPTVTSLPTTPSRPPFFSRSVFTRSPYYFLSLILY